jgi:alanyl-tRNA synthetase
MRALSTDEIRQKYLEFFREHKHTVIPGASLVPENDPTVLFTTAGMHPLVPYLLGESHPGGRRLANVQRCVRTQDIEEVGDASHLTFFEMLGNWSLGDYFKEEAIALSLEFLTSKQWLDIPMDMLAITCFEGDRDAPKDEESAKVWEKVGIPRERIGFLPKSKNWWGPAGQSGPCGPDTEMFFWVGRGKPQGNPATHEAEWLEIWNDVFMQYNKTKDGTFEPLKQKNVDTGMGLERTAAVMQGKKNVYETDRMNPILQKVLNGSPSADHLKHARIIVDHLRAATFIIGDGVLPSNVDRGYVLRRLIRRAIRSAKQITHEGAGTCVTIAEEVIHQYSTVYPHLSARAAVITQTLSQEETQFGKTLQEGLKQFEKAIAAARGTLDGVTTFHLYDTYGFPLELTGELARERGLTIDEEGFRKAFSEHQKLSRAGAEQRFKGGLQDHSSETTKLHTATHLLHAALRKVLGDHVYQKGSNITAERLRFDFSHGDKMTMEQLKEVERLVNKAIADDLPVTFHVTTVEGAKSEGAIGVFDARYGAEVKVYVVGDSKRGTVFSKEICGGPHAARTGILGTFTIQKEESSSAGVRRIKAILEGDATEIGVAKETK